MEGPFLSPISSVAGAMSQALPLEDTSDRGERVERRRHAAETHSCAAPTHRRPVPPHPPTAHQKTKSALPTSRKLPNWIYGSQNKRVSTSLASVGSTQRPKEQEGTRIDTPRITVQHSMLEREVWSVYAFMSGHCVMKISLTLLHTQLNTIRSTLQYRLVLYKRRTPAVL